MKKPLEYKIRLEMNQKRKEVKENFLEIFDKKLTILFNQFHKK